MDISRIVLIAKIVLFFIIVLYLIWRHLYTKAYKEQTDNPNYTFSDLPDKHLKSAEKMVDMGEYRLCLAAVRNSLEALVKVVAAKHSFFSDTTKAQLEEIIDGMSMAGILTDEESRKMHKLRMDCNAGHHVELYEQIITEDFAKSTLKRMRSLEKDIRGNEKHATVVYTGMAKKKPDTRVFAVMLILFVAAASFGIYEKINEWKEPLKVPELLTEEHVEEYAEGIIEDGKRTAISTGGWPVEPAWTAEPAMALLVSPAEKSTVDNTFVIAFYECISDEAFPSGEPREIAFRAVLAKEDLEFDSKSKSASRKIGIYKPMKDKMNIVGGAIESAKQYAQVLEYLRDEEAAGNIRLVELDIK